MANNVPDTHANVNVINRTTTTISTNTHHYY
jgi:hypothetical protein